VSFGIDTARRGWARADDVLNARPLATLLDWLAYRRKHARA